jgi:hypothetical protein
MLDMSYKCLDSAERPPLLFAPAMSATPGKPAIHTIRFTRRLAAQCRSRTVGLPEWVVCDTIANGAREPVGRRGAEGGWLFRFEKTYPAARVRVLGEMTAQGCFAVALLSPANHRGRNWEESRFLNRTASK